MHTRHSVSLPQSRAATRLRSVAVLFEVAGGAEPPHCVDLDHNRDARLLGVLLTLRLDNRVVDLRPRTRATGAPERTRLRRPAFVVVRHLIGEARMRVVAAGEE